MLTAQHDDGIFQVNHTGPSRAEVAWRRSFRVAVAAIVAIACILGVSASAASAASATFSASASIPVPPASNFAGSGGGDGWAVALSETAVYNVFHHQTTLQVACHLQATAEPCFSPRTITDLMGQNFATSGQPGLYLDQQTGKLYVYATRTSDETAGVVCINTTEAVTNSDPFCGFTALTPVGGAPRPSGISGASAPMLVGNHFYAFNFVNGVAQTGAENALMCFDVSTDEACSGQPYAIAIGAGKVSDGGFPSPATAAVDGKVIVPLAFEGANNRLACFDPSTGATCAGSWPVTLGTNSYAGNYGAPYPLMNSSATTTGLCIPTGTDQCFTLEGATTATPSGMTSVIQASSPWNGGAFVLGPRIYVPNGNLRGDTGEVECFDYSTGASCANFPKSFENLGYLYTVNPDPQRPTCIWVNSDSGSHQIQDFDAYTGKPCGQGTIRALASQIVVPQPECKPASYISLQIIKPEPSAYTSATVAFDSGDGTAIPGLEEKTLDETGTVSLSGLELNTPTGLPEFLLTFNGVTGKVGTVEVKLTWTGNYNETCEGEHASSVTFSETPTNAAPPKISGKPLSGHKVACERGEWTNTRPTGYSYQWYRDGEEISGATNTEYEVKGEDEGQTLICEVTATNNAGAAKARSKGSEVLEAPEDLTLPSVTGERLAGKTLTCERGTWTGSPTGYTYKWYRGEEEISGAAESKYIVQSADRGHVLTCEVTASNEAGAGAPATSKGVEVLALPANTAVPTISGEDLVGKTLTCGHGSWTNSPTGYSYQWYRDGNEISGATESNYTVQAADSGHTLTCEVTASNLAGESAPATSKGKGVLGTPGDATRPVLSGEALAGKTLTCEHGSWTNSPTAYSYQWYRDGSEISGATGSEYVAQTGDREHTLTCEVTASNAAGESTPATSKGVDVLGLPAETALPSLEGEALAGKTLSCEHGSWTNSPTGYTYQWYRDGNEISGATESKYTVQSADRGHTLTCKVIASNAAGESTPATGKGVEVLGLPAETALPSVEGEAQTGKTLTCEHGSWTNSPTGYTYQWYRDGSEISGATGSEYVAQTGDREHTLTCEVTASNAAGESTPATSNGVEVLGLPAETALPSLEGEALAGKTLTCEHGSWTNSPTGYTYQWYRDGNEISGATESKYVAQTGDREHTLTCEVTASNAAGESTPATSNGVEVLGLPAETALPSLEGEALAGKTLTCEHGSWTNSPTGYTYRWYRDGNEISGATESKYTVQSADRGHTLTCKVIASNAAGESTPATTKGVEVLGLPSETEPPSITGEDVAGKTLTCEHGSWTNSPTGYGYQWYRDGNEISGATGSEYEVQSSDQGQTLTCGVTASNLAGDGVAAASKRTEVPAPPVKTASPVVGAPAAASTPTPLQCSGQDIVLVSVLSSGHSVELSGDARTQYAGDTVTITLSDVSASASKRKGGTTVVSPNGTFQVSVPALSPKAMGSVRYTAWVAGRHSRALKLARLLQITGDVAVKGGSVVGLKLNGHYRGSRTVTLTRLVGCAGTVKYKTMTLGHSGAKSIFLPASSTANTVTYYRAETHVPGGKTFTLPIVVSNS